MKKCICFFMMMVLGFTTYSQADTCYHFKVEYDMQLSFFGMTSYKSALFFTKTQSLFRYQANSLDNETSEEIIENIASINKRINMCDTTINYIIQNRLTNESTELSKPIVKNDWYEIKEEIPKISWIILPDSKQIGKYNCNKASCNFRGRDYVAWFTTEIQTSFGPLKLSGLPGLILELFDSKREIYLCVKTVVNEVMPTINKPDVVKTISRTEYKSAVIKKLKNLDETEKFLSSQMDRGYTVKVKMSPPKAIEMDWFTKPD